MACTVDSLTQMAVTAPVDQIDLPGLRLLGVTLVVWCAIFLTANTIAYFVG